MQLSQQQAYSIYGSITSEDAHFIHMMAKAAIESTLDMTVDLFRDAEPDLAVPGDADIRRRAAELVAEMVESFRTALLIEIDQIEFTANIKDRRELSASLVFLK